MNRVYATREMSPAEMQALANQLGRCGFPTAAVGKNYIAFYERVEIRRMTDGVQRNAQSAGQASGAKRK